MTAQVSSRSFWNPFASEAKPQKPPALPQSLTIHSLGSAGKVSTGIQLQPPYISDNSLLRNLERTLRDFGKSQHEIETLVNSVYSNKKVVPLTFSHYAHSAQGKRPSMEDQHFARETENAFIFGICDGHADNQQISNLLATTIEAEYENEVKAANGDVAKAAQNLINRIHQRVINEKLPGGSTVSFGFIDKKTNIGTSVNLGDSEIRLYRKKGSKIEGSEIECIPISRVVDWRSPNEAERAAKALGLPRIADEWPKVAKQDAKLLRAPLIFGLNLSRAVGDTIYQFWVQDVRIQLITQKVKVLQFKVEKGDVLVAACDGLWDVEARRLVPSILRPNWNQSPEAMAEKIVTFALNTCRSTDNVSVVVVKT